MPRDTIAGSAVVALLLAFSSSAGAAAEAAGPRPLPEAATAFAPGFADLMAMLVAPRHAKLHYAAEQRNWELATFQLQQLRSSLQRTESTIPVYLGRNVAETISALMEPHLKATESAIASADTKQFVRAYRELTAACNACHAYLEHPFLVVKVPAASASNAYPAQDFKPQQ
jgi:hypothetical protein